MSWFDWHWRAHFTGVSITVQQFPPIPWQRTVSNETNDNKTEPEKRISSKFHLAFYSPPPFSSSSSSSSYSFFCFLYHCLLKLLFFIIPGVDCFSHSADFRPFLLVSCHAAEILHCRIPFFENPIVYIENLLHIIRNRFNPSSRLELNKTLKNIHTFIRQKIHSGVPLMSKSRISWTFEVEIEIQLVVLVLNEL